jgi:hypothetical protein
LYPGWTIPPFRVEAPQPTRSASSSTTLAPSSADRRAADSPVNPPPMTTTSATSGSGVARRSARSGIVACQKLRSVTPSSAAIRAIGAQ